MDLFSFYKLHFPRWMPCYCSLGNCFCQISTFSRAYVSFVYQRQKANTLENITWPAGKKQITFFSDQGNFYLFFFFFNQTCWRNTSSSYNLLWKQFLLSLLFFLFKHFRKERIIVCIFLFTGSWAYIRGDGLFVGEWAYKLTFTVGKLSFDIRKTKENVPYRGCGPFE